MWETGLGISAIEFYRKIPSVSKICGVWNDYMIIDAKVYVINTGISEYMEIDYLINTVSLEGGYLLYSTNQSVVLVDLTTHQSCLDPIHKHLESQIILYRGISPAKVLCLGEYACIHLQDNIVLYRVDGSIKATFPSDLPEETSILCDVIVTRFLNKVCVIDINTLKETKSIDVQSRCLSKGNYIYIGLEATVVDLDMNVILEIRGNLLSMGAYNNLILLGFVNTIQVYYNQILSKEISINDAMSCYHFTEDFILGANAYQDFVSVFKIEYNSNGSDKESIEYEDASDISQVLVTPNQDVNVIMTFEPISNLLNNFSSKTKKPVKKGKIENKPVTFHKKIKSSGYGANQKPAKRPKNLLATVKPYPMSCPPPSILDEDQNFPKDSPLHNGPIFNISYSKDGTRLGSCGGDGAAYILKLPISKYKGDRIPLVGHEFQVNSITWSSDCSYSLTTSNKYCTKLWSLAGPKPGECLLTMPGNFIDGKFYYVDKFISVVQGNEIILNRYKLRDPFLKDDVKRLQAKCLYKEVLRIKQSSAQGITRIACHNSFHSHIMLCAGTNKVVSAWDMDKQAEVAAIQTIHRKPIHTLRFYTGSDFADIDQDSLNIFCCSSSDNYVSLYDIRTNQNPCLLVGHVNTALEVGASISPCRMYIASGSEDRSAYVWDLRTAKVLHRLKGFKEITSDVAWNPAFPQICVAGNEGHIKFFQTPKGL